MTKTACKLKKKTTPGTLRASITEDSMLAYKSPCPTRVTRSASTLFTAINLEL